MRMLKAGELKPGMVLGEPVLNHDGTIDLLTSGTVLTTRHIALLERLGIETIQIADPEDVKSMASETDTHEQIRLFEERIQSEGQAVDLTASHEADEALRIAAKVFEVTTEGLMVLDADGRVRRVMDRPVTRMLMPTGVPARLP